jgi:hypothetical protein
MTIKIGTTKDCDFRITGKLNIRKDITIFKVAKNENKDTTAATTFFDGGVDNVN